MRGNNDDRSAHAKSLILRSSTSFAYTIETCAVFATFGVDDHRRTASSISFNWQARLFSVLTSEAGKTCGPQPVFEMSRRPCRKMSGNAEKLRFSLSATLVSYLATTLDGLRPGRMVCQEAKEIEPLSATSSPHLIKSKFFSCWHNPLDSLIELFISN